MNRERLTKIRNFQSDDWYPALFLRPLTILLMLVIADWKFLTPNRLTHLANLSKIAACLCFWPDAPAYLGMTTMCTLVVGVVLLNLGAILDNCDGTMARYRGVSSVFGSLYDKSSDAVTWFAICGVVGWRAFSVNSEGIYLVLALTSAYVLCVRGYMKWLVTLETERFAWHQVKNNPAIIAEKTKPFVPSRPPERSTADWLRWLGKTSIQFYRFEEMDLFFWVSLGILLRQDSALCWLLMISQMVGFIGMFVTRHREAHQLDVRRAAHFQQQRFESSP